MNAFQAVVCIQYAELKKKGKEKAAKTNGLVLVVAAWTLNILSIAFLLYLLGFDLVKVFGLHGSNGRSLGRLIAILLMAGLYPIAYLFLGRQSSYNATISSFESLDDAGKKKVVEKGLVYFIVSMVVFFAIFICLLIKK